MNDQPASEIARYEFFKKYRDNIWGAIAVRDLAPFMALASSDEYKALFGDIMFFDAEKRYGAAPVCPVCGAKLELEEARSGSMTSIRRYCERCGYSTSETWPVKLPD